jgi:hypothetical protein
MRKRPARDPFHREIRTEPAPLIDPATVMAGFLISPELAGLAPADRELFWVQGLLDVMHAADWTWDDLDLAGLWAALFDGLRWSIDRVPDDVGRVARVLDAFLRHAGRVHDAPHALVCCAYLRSDRAVNGIRRWLAPAESRMAE